MIRISDRAQGIPIDVGTRVWSYMYPGLQQSMLFLGEVRVWYLSWVAGQVRTVYSIGRGTLSRQRFGLLKAADT